MIKEDDLKVIIAKDEYAKGKKQLQQFEDNNQNPLKKWLLVASVLLLISISSFWIFSSSNESPEKIYTQYFEPYTNVVAPISRTDNAKSVLENAFLFYENKQYQKAIIAFDEVLKTTDFENQKSINLYKAISLLELQKTEKAISILKGYSLVNQKFKDKYLWYLGLAYLQKNDVENAKKTFEILSKESTNFKAKETSSILKSLE